MPKDFNDCNI